MKAVTNVTFYRHLYLSFAQCLLACLNAFAEPRASASHTRYADDIVVLL